MTLVFINYRGSDSAWAVLLDRELSRQFGSDRVFQASRSIPVGSDFEEWLMSHLRRSSVLLAIIGPDWSAAVDGSGRRRLLDEKDWVRREIAEAFTLGIPVIPVLVNDAARLDGAELPDDIARLARCQYLRLHYRNAAYDVTRLVDELVKLAPGPRMAADAGRPGGPDSAGEAARTPSIGKLASRRLPRRRRDMILAAVVVAIALTAGFAFLAGWRFPGAGPGGAQPSGGEHSNEVLFDGVVTLRQGDYVRLGDGMISQAVTDSDLSFDYFGGDWDVFPAEQATIAVPDDGRATRESCGHLLEQRNDSLVSLRNRPKGYGFCVRTNDRKIATAELDHFSPATQPHQLTLKITIWE